jgi:glycosyltransferase involved in cell wall biosynthesis
MALISIIVPVYNVEKYLRRCIDSILAQTFTDFECILIDDGSLDNCPSICDEYAAKNSRIVVIHQINKGPASTRDVGVKIAQGEFLFFVDSDDWLEKCSLESLYQKQQEINADIVLGGFRQINIYDVNECYFQDIKNLDIITYFLLCKYKYLWGKLYRKLLFDNYIVPETNILEDGIVNIQIFSRLKYNKIAIIKKIIYNHDNQTDGLINQLNRSSKYDSYIDYPMVQSCFWIENYLKQINSYNEDNKSAFIYLLLSTGIIPFIRNRRGDILSCEIKYIYKNYYQKCRHLYLLDRKRKILIFVFYISIFFGKLTVKIFLLFSTMKHVLYRTLKLDKFK